MQLWHTQAIKGTLARTCRQAQQTHRDIRFSMTFEQGESVFIILSRVGFYCLQSSEMWQLYSTRQLNWQLHLTKNMFSIFSVGQILNCITGSKLWIMLFRKEGIAPVHLPLCFLRAKRKRHYSIYLENIVVVNCHKATPCYSYPVIYCFFSWHDRNILPARLNLN